MAFSLTEFSHLDPTLHDKSVKKSRNLEIFLTIPIPIHTYQYSVTEFPVHSHSRSHYIMRVDISAITTTLLDGKCDMDNCPKGISTSGY